MTTGTFECPLCGRDSPHTHSEDEQLIGRALSVLEHVTYHDGRYCQEQQQDWQAQAQPLVKMLAARMGVNPYRNYRM
jgi:hypothetical protein